MTFFVSDPHYHHANILRFTGRPYKTIEDMNEDLIRKHNERVTKFDTVYFLGDMFFCRPEKGWEILSRLNGKTKILVRGNHDLSPNAMYRIGFDVVCESMTIKIGKSYVNLSHYPYRYDRWRQFVHDWILFKKSPRAMKKRLRPDGNWLLHGHTHSKERVNVEAKMIHVGIDAWDGYPVPITKISEIIDRHS